MLWCGQYIDCTPTALLRTERGLLVNCSRASSAAERRAENIKWRRRGANQKLLKTCLALAIMADTWTWSAGHQDHYRYTNENGNKTGLIIKITAERLTRSRTLGDSLGKTNTAARWSAKVCLSDQILALIHLTCFQ